MASSSKPKNFINDPSKAVSEFIEGLLLQYPNRIRKLENHNVLLSSEINYDKVNILSGGGSGHEPSHAGWIASKGMLTGAILGGIFASPSVSSILAAIRAVTKVRSGKGCLLIVKNYTGDRLNFGMACELANAEGRQCQMVVVADDAALERSKGVTGARGVAGTVFVHKVAGAAAQMGLSLEDVVEAASHVSERIGSLGVALDAVTIPGATSTNDRLDGNTIEIGLGIHGEAGIRQSEMKSADELAEIMVTTILEYGLIEKCSEKVIPTFKNGDQLAVMVNNLGGVSNFEMSILANSVVKVLENKYKSTVNRLYVGGFMTSFNMQGASVSIISMTDASDNTSKYLDAETDALSWVHADNWSTNGVTRPSQAEVPEITVCKSDHVSHEKVKVEIENFSERSKDMVKSACALLIESEPTLTKYDTIVGDGDCGITMERGAKEILSRLENEQLNSDHPVALFESLASAVSASMGGTSGILLELMFRKMSTFLNNEEIPVDNDCLIQAFEEGVNVVSFYGGATEGSRTMLDALYPAVKTLKSGNNLEAAAEASMTGANGTAEMGSASAGRSNYLSEDALTGTPDPGAVAVALVLNAIGTK